jgi:hypothetical protein
MGLRYLYRSPTSNSRLVRSVRLKWTGHSAGLGDNRKVCRNFIGNPFESIHFGDQKQDERTALRLKSLVATDANIRILDQVLFKYHEFWIDLCDKNFEARYLFVFSGYRLLFSLLIFN